MNLAEYRKIYFHSRDRSRGVLVNNATGEHIIGLIAFADDRFHSGVNLVEKSLQSFINEKTEEELPNCEYHILSVREHPNTGKTTLVRRRSSFSIMPFSNA